MAPADVEDIVVDIPADTGAEAAEDEHEGFLGGPSDPSVLTQYADHIACSVWTGEERPELKLSSHRRKVHSLGKPVLAIEGLVAGTGLSPLIACLVDTGDRGLLSSFVERWHRKTSSFHPPVGELTITLDDVSSLLHLPVVGDLHAFQSLHVDDVAGHWTAAARAYFLHLLGCTLFANKSATNVHVVYLEALHDLSMTGSAGFTSTFPQSQTPLLIRNTMRIPRVRIPYGEHRSVRDFHVISCYSNLLCSGPVVVYYRPERVVRQFGYTQTITAPPVVSWVSYDDIHDRWMHYSDHIVPAGEVCAMPEVCDDIAERLEHHLSLGVVTPGSSTHEVIEECLRMARSVTQNHLVYVRSRRRRRTD
ncbi:Protein MAIN-LIKE 1 [Glycine max]|nr:Protein MAIN-LIKE 1 [Glycine max]